MNIFLNIIIFISLENLQPPVFQNLPDASFISEDIDVDTQLKVLTVTDASLADTVTCYISKTNPTTTDLYLRYASGKAGKDIKYVS